MLVMRVISLAKSFRMGLPCLQMGKSRRDVIIIIKIMNLRLDVKKYLNV